MPNDPVVAAPVAAATQSPAEPAAVVAPVVTVAPSVDATKQAEADKAARAIIEKDVRVNVEKEVGEAYKGAAKKQAAEWSVQAKADPEIGGVDFDANLNTAKSVLKSFADPKFYDYLEETGYGNHPSMIKLLTKIAKAVGPDKLLAGGQGSGQGQAKSAAEVLYGGTMKAK